VSEILTRISEGLFLATAAVLQVQLEYLRFLSTGEHVFISFHLFHSLLRIKAAHNTLQYIKRSSSTKREEIKTNTTVKETNVENKRKTLVQHTFSLVAVEFRHHCLN